jgi:hypothetical protein
MAASLAAADVAGVGELVGRVLGERSFREGARSVAESARALPLVEAAPDVLAAVAGRRWAA